MADVLPYGIPEGNIGGYYPEYNALTPLWHHAECSKTPAAKSILVRVQRSQLWTTVFEKQRPLGRIPCQPSRGREGLYVAEYSGEMASFEGNRS